MVVNVFYFHLPFFNLFFIPINITITIVIHFILPNHSSRRAVHLPSLDVTRELLQLLQEGADVGQLDGSL